MQDLKALELVEPGRARFKVINRTEHKELDRPVSLESTVDVKIYLHEGPPGFLGSAVALGLASTTMCIIMGVALANGWLLDTDKKSKVTSAAALISALPVLAITFLPFKIDETHPIKPPLSARLSLWLSVAVSLVTAFLIGTQGFDGDLHPISGSMKKVFFCSLALWGVGYLLFLWLRHYFVTKSLTGRAQICWMVTLGLGTIYAWMFLFATVLTFEFGNSTESVISMDSFRNLKILSPTFLLGNNFSVIALLATLLLPVSV